MIHGESHQLPPRQLIAVERIRARILGGEFAPGDQLPSKLQLVEELGLSSVTVQRALDYLAKEGFLTKKARSGSYISTRPPHLVNYVAVFPHTNLGELLGNKFHAAVFKAVQELASPEHVISYVMGPKPYMDHPEYRRFHDDVTAHRLAGIFLSYPPHELAKSPTMTQPGIPRVMISPQAWPGIQAVSDDTMDFHRKALRYLLSRGRRRIAVLISRGGGQDPAAPVLQEAKRLGLRVEPHWVHAFFGSTMMYARNCVSALMRLRDDDRPDGLYITDDHITEHACAGVSASGVRVPEDLEIVSRWNSPNEANHAVPVRRLCVDVRQLVRVGFGSFQQQRLGQDVTPQPILLPAVWEEQVLAATPGPAFSPATPG